MKASIHRAANVQFERAVLEYARWRALPERARSHAPAWWWGAAFELRGVPQPMPDAWCASLDLPDRASYADGAAVFLKCLADQTTLPWLGSFPGDVEHANSA